VKEFFKNLFSVDEFRFSALIIGFFILIGFGGYEIVNVGDISPNVSQVIIYLGAFIAGINVFPSIANLFNTIKGKLTSANQSAEINTENQSTEEITNIQNNNTNTSNNETESPI
jgi:ABC-type multidrug transport system fused ATPase/permease subunit